ncbi:MAG: class I SAM-dependent methyltransferase [Gemmatimonadota bacterium]
MNVSALYGSSYDGFVEDPAFVRAVDAELETRFREFLPPPARILDFGCGNGVFLRRARRAGYEVVGYDISESAAACCREQGLTAYAGQTAPLREQPLFDAITLWDVIEHLEKPGEVIALAAELLRPGGWLVVKTPRLPGAAFALARMVAPLRGAMLQIPAHLQFFSEGSLGRLLQRHGFSTVRFLPIRPMRSAAKGGKIHPKHHLLSAALRATGCGNHYAWARRD